MVNPVCAIRQLWKLKFSKSLLKGRMHSSKVLLISSLLTPSDSSNKRKPPPPAPQSIAPFIRSRIISSDINRLTGSGSAPECSPAITHFNLYDSYMCSPTLSQDSFRNASRTAEERFTSFSTVSTISLVLLDQRRSTC